MRLWIVGSFAAIAASFLFWPVAAPSCDERTPITFVVSTSPYVCDFTRGAGPLAP